MPAGTGRFGGQVWMLSPEEILLLRILFPSANSQAQP